MINHQCENVIILGDLNPPGIQRSFDSLLAVFSLHNHVTFPTHRSGSSLDPVLTDFPSHDVQCSPLGLVGSSDHEAVFTSVAFRRLRDEYHPHPLAMGGYGLGWTASLPGTGELGGPAARGHGEVGRAIH